MIFFESYEAQTVARAPAIDFGPPGLEMLIVAGGLFRFPCLGDFFQRQRGVGQDRHIDPHVLVDRRGIDIDLDFFRVGREGRQPARHAIVEARADRDHHIAIVHRHVGFVHAVHADHADRQFVGAGKTAQPHQRLRAGETGQAHQLAERLGRGRTRIHHAAADIEERLLGLRHQLHRRRDRAGVGLGLRTIAFVALFRRTLIGAVADQDILG